MPKRQLQTIYLPTLAGSSEPDDISRPYFWDLAVPRGVFLGLMLIRPYVVDTPDFAL